MQIDWKLTCDTIFKNRITDPHTNPAQTAKNCFHLKTFLNKRPTLDEMQGQYPETYTDATCPECNETIETNTHVFTCPNRQRVTISKMTNALIKALTSFSNEFKA